MSRPRLLSVAMYLHRQPNIRGQSFHRTKRCCKRFPRASTAIHESHSKTKSRVRIVQARAPRSSDTTSPEPSDSSSLARLGNNSGRHPLPYGKNVTSQGSPCLWCLLLGKKVRLLLSACPQVTLTLESATKACIVALVSLRGVTAAARRDWHFTRDPVAIAGSR